MSMICVLRQVEEAEIEYLLSHPEEIHNFLCGDENEEIEERIKGEIDLDKAWHGLHFLLTGSAWDGEEPLCYLVRGGHEIGDEDVGWGPVRAISPDVAASFDAALTQVTADDLRQRFNPAEMMKQQIYPEIWDRDPEVDDTLGYLVEYYGSLTRFVRETRDTHKGLIVFLA